MTGILVAAAAIGLPLAFFVAWPLIRHRGAPVLLPLPPDPREPLLERKAAALRALRELDFEHESAHIADDDYAELRARYESEAAAVLSELDRLVPTPARAARPAHVAARGSAWRHPFALGAAAVALVMSADGAQRGELVDHGLRLFDRALAIDPNYPPALFYRGQVLYDLKRDAAGAIAAWEKFVAVAPPGEDRERVAKQIAEAKAATPKR